MDNLKNIEEMIKYQEQVKELFKILATTELYEAWADTFEIEDFDGKRVTITYFGDRKIKKFKKTCKKILKTCIESVFGEGKKLKIIKKSKYSSLSPKAKKNLKVLKFFVIGMIFVCIATGVVVLLCNYIGNRNFRETFYITSSIKVDSSIRVVQLSDLHGASYGKNNKRLLERVEELKPDVIVCTGDMVNSVKDDFKYIMEFGRKLAKIAPAYYVYGNNEVETVYGFPLNEKELDKKFGFTAENRDETALRNLKDTFEENLEKTGVKVLKDEKDTIKVKTMNVDIYGILNSNPSSFWSYSENSFLDYVNNDTNNIKITVVHEPFIFETFEQDFWGDLMVAGHTHGGIVRVPVLGPLYTHEEGLFPERSDKFVYGRYNISGRPLIVSGGLENSNVFRVNNQPELVVIDINKF